MLTKDGREPQDINGEEVLALLRTWKATGIKPKAEGWVFGKGSSSPATYYSHYQDGHASEVAFWVPTVYLWSSGREEVGGFTRHPIGHCGYCGTLLEPDWHDCPACGEWG